MKIPDDVKAAISVKGQHLIDADLKPAHLKPGVTPFSFLLSFSFFYFPFPSTPISRYHAGCTLMPWLSGSSVALRGPWLSTVTQRGVRSMAAYGE